MTWAGIAACNGCIVGVKIRLELTHMNKLLDSKFLKNPSTKLPHFDRIDT